jgi:dihydrofolate synthase / folylpolyglutamate synthase
VSYQEAIEFLYDLRWFGVKLGLANTFKLAALTGNPQNGLRFIHVAGTNGKGSTCAMLESIYRRAGLRVGLFTSPHLVSFNERIQVNRRPINDDAVAGLVARVRSLLKEFPEEQHPTFFEVVTLVGLLYFAAQKCDLVVWETGMGGRLDATNIVTPLASVITNVQFDHQKWLGETLGSIASEKAGIIKPGIPVITGAFEPEALHVIVETARHQNAPLTVVMPSERSRPPLDELQLPLPGHHQKMNAAVALDTVRTLADIVPVSEVAIREGLGSVEWAGRLQRLAEPSGRVVLLDGAHNVGGAEMLAAALKEYYPEQRPCLVLGILRDKDWLRMCELLAPLASRILLVPVHSTRSAEPHGLAEACRHANPQARVSEHPTLVAALEDIAEEPFVTIAGSLYLVGEAMELLHVSPAAASSERGLNDWATAIQPPPKTRSP